MKIACPHCERTFELKQAVREMEHAETADIAAQFGKQWRLVWEYSECFRQAEYSDVSLTRRLRIFREIAGLFERPVFTLQGKQYRTAWAEIIRAMTGICNAQKWGFQNHNYLKTILRKTADRVSAEGKSAAEEQEREEERQAGIGERAVAKEQGGRIGFGDILNQLPGGGTA